MQYDFDVKNVFHGLSDEREVKKYIGKEVYLGDTLDEIQENIDKNMTDTLDRFVFGGFWPFKAGDASCNYCLPATQL